MATVSHLELFTILWKNGISPSLPERKYAEHAANVVLEQHGLTRASNPIIIDAIDKKAQNFTKGIQKRYNEPLSM